MDEQTDMQARNVMVDYIIETLDVRENRNIRTILELGSGDGTTKRLSDHGYNMISIED